MSVMRSVSSLAVAGALVGLTIAGAWGQAAKPAAKWEAPAAEKAKKNPVPRNKESIDAGKKTAEQFCVVCHGSGGKGDGQGAAALPKKPADWTSKAVQEESDGSLFWKVSKGNPPMPSWEAAIPEKDRWNLVNYIRSLAAKK